MPPCILHFIIVKDYSFFQLKDLFYIKVREDQEIISIR